jgi:putative transposase
MNNKKRKSLQQKVLIVAEAQENGWVETARKHNVSFPTLKSWKLKLDSGGEAALAGSQTISHSDLRKLMVENQQLKELVAEKELHIRIQRDFLKKK